MIKHEDANMLAYFWKEKGNPERYVRYKECIDEFPLFKQAWINYKLASAALDQLSEQLEYYDG